MKTIIEKILSRISITKNGCWIWTGAKTRSGYGHIRIRSLGKNLYVHRLIFEFFKEKIKHGNVVCHCCDVRLCINPNHLFQGTQKDNLHDCIDKDRFQRGERHYMSKLTKDQVLSIREDSRPDPVIAKEYGISTKNVSLIQLKKTWGWLEGEKL